MFMNDEVLGNVIMDVLEMWSGTRKARKDYDRTRNNDEETRSRRITTIIEYSDDEY